MVTSCGTITVRDGWVICPICGKGKLVPVKTGTVIRKVDQKCKRCSCITEVNYEAPEPASKETSA